MKANTVILDLQKYTELKTIADAVENRQRIFIGCWHNNMELTYLSIDKKDFENVLIKKLKQQEQECHKLAEENNYLKYLQNKQITINDVKKMSICQFIKWRKQ